MVLSASLFCFHPSIYNIPMVSSNFHKHNNDSSMKYIFILDKKQQHNNREMLIEKK